MRGRRRTWRIAIGAAAVVLAAAAALAGGPPGAAQAEPPGVILPAVDPGPDDTTGVRVVGCTADELVVQVIAQLSDVIAPVPMTDEGGGSWVVELGPSPTDLHLSFGACDEGTPEDATIDVENPILSRGGLVPEDSPFVHGTDCPDGATPDVEVVQGGVEIGLTPSAPDAEGDWTVEVPGAPLVAGQATVHATCGTVAYEDLVITVVGGPPPSSTESTTTTDPAGPSTPPATPVPAAAAFTG